MGDKNSKFKHVSELLSFLKRILSCLIGIVKIFEAQDFMAKCVCINFFWKLISLSK